MNELLMERVSLSLSEEQHAWLNAHSDHPMTEGYIFSRVFQNHDSLAAFLSELSAVFPTVAQPSARWLTRYDETWFADQSLLVMFSEERSGSSRLQLHQACVEGTRADLIISRTRGLTMDMAYLFLFHALRGHEVCSSSVRIEENRQAEAVLF